MSRLAYSFMTLLCSQYVMADRVNCELHITPENGTSKVIKIENRMPGVKLRDGIFCNSETLTGFQKFEAPDGSPWIFSFYADRSKETFVNVRTYEVSVGESPQIDLAVRQAPCQLAKSNNAVAAHLKTKSGVSFRLNLRCK